MDEQSGGCKCVFGEGERRDPDYVKKRSDKRIKFDLICGNPEHGLCPVCGKLYGAEHKAVGEILDTMRGSVPARLALVDIIHKVLEPAYGAIEERET